MTTRQFDGSAVGLIRSSGEQNLVKRVTKAFYLREIPKGLGCGDVMSRIHLRAKKRIFPSPLVTDGKRSLRGFVVHNQSSSGYGTGYGVESTDLQEKLVLEDEHVVNGARDQDT